MNARLRALQRWVNLMGWTPTLAEDGVAGPITREAIIGIFANRSAPAVTSEQVAAFARRLGGSSRQVMAVALTESAGGGFLDSGHPKALWERHYYAKRINAEIPGLADFTPGGYSTDADRDGINDSWEHIADAAMTHPQFAFECASFGKFQVMGAWWEKLGYAHALEFVWLMRESEAGHYEALARYIEKLGGKAAFQSISARAADCLPFAKFYNGPAQKGYHERIAANFRRLS